MANEIAKRDQNNIPVLTGITDDASQEIRMLRVDPNDGRLLVSSSGGGGGLSLITLLSGDVNGTNRDFEFSELPTLVSSDGQLLQQVTVNGFKNWQITGLTTIQLALAPSVDVFGLA